MNNLGDMPTEMFIDLLNRAKTKATPEVVQRLQDINEVYNSKNRLARLRNTRGCYITYPCFELTGVF